MQKDLTSVSLPTDLVKELDEFIDGNIVSTRTHAIRVAIALWLQSRREKK